MTDKLYNQIAIGDSVILLHKKRPTTTATLQIGTITSFPTKRTARVKVDGMSRGEFTDHTRLTIIKYK